MAKTGTGRGVTYKLTRALRKSERADWPTTPAPKTLGQRAKRFWID